MAFIFKDSRPNIGWKMAAGDKELSKWLYNATYAKTANGYWIAWRKDIPDQAVILSPNHPKDQPAPMLDDWDDNPSLEGWIEYVESGEFEREPPEVLNLFIEDPETGEWK